jgi:uncharacterized membrane protein
MAEPFADFVIPPLAHSAGLVIATVFVVVLLLAVKPPIDQKTVLAFAPWIISGAVLHVFYQLSQLFRQQLFPEMIEPLFSAPAVYLTTFVIMGVIWAVATMFMTAPDPDSAAQYLGGMGIGTMVPLVALLVWRGTDPAVRPMEPVWPVAGLLLSIAASFVLILLIGLWRTTVIAKVKYVGPLVIFAHVFDGITTAIGVDIVGVGERSALPRLIIDFAADLPTEGAIGSGWLFVLVKIIIASTIVVLFADYVSDRPSEASIIMGLVVAVGLGPATHNFFLFLLAP